MMNLKGTLAHGIHPVAPGDKESTHSPADEKPYRIGQGIEKSAFDKLLASNEEFFRTMSMELADMLVRMRIPSFLIEDLIQEAWLSAVQHRDLFVGEYAKRLLRGFLRKAVHDKAVDVRRHLDSCPFQSFDGQEMALTDEVEAQRAELAEQHELLEALLDDAGGDHEENKELVRAHFVQGVTVAELAQRSGWSVDAVESRIRRLVEKMRANAKNLLAASPRLTLS
ncbi:MAG TPA: sigma-70 family RNA polymerase sigma factor [Gemmataceae bacterium]|nr:sigma-70 family RNA polymerase sigma factor [Gemmataceae bacterium]